MHCTNPISQRRSAHRSTLVQGVVTRNQIKGAARANASRDSHRAREVGDRRLERADYAGFRTRGNNDLLHNDAMLDAYRVSLARWVLRM